MGDVGACVLIVSQVKAAWVLDCPAAAASQTTLIPGQLVGLSACATPWSIAVWHWIGFIDAPVSTRDPPTAVSFTQSWLIAVH